MTKYELIAKLYTADNQEIEKLHDIIDIILEYLQSNDYPIYHDIITLLKKERTI
jgi:hypothetical protein